LNRKILEKEKSRFIKSIVREHQEDNAIKVTINPDVLSQLQTVKIHAKQFLEDTEHLRVDSSPASK